MSAYGTPSSLPYTGYNAAAPYAAPSQAPTTVSVPSLPNENNYYQLPDAHYGGTVTNVNRYHQQAVYTNQKVVVEDHIVWQPIHYRTYKELPPETQYGPVQSWMEGEQPPAPALPMPASQGIAPGGCYGNGGGYGTPAMPGSPMPMPAGGGNLLQQITSMLTTVLSMLQQLLGGGSPTPLMY
ncbi:MAG: hypothetical protein U0003_02505 [Vampirovibrionales bacterium]